MKKTLILMLALSSLMACSPAKEAEQEKLQAEAQVRIESEHEAFNAERMRDYNSEESLAVRKKMQVEDRFIRPKMSVRLEVLALDADIRNEEIERSFLYRRTGVELCYANALVVDEKLAGRIEIKLSIDDKGVLSLADFSSTFKDETLNTCLKTSAERWTIHRSGQLPKAKLAIALDFSAAPPPTIEEILGKPLEPSDAVDDGQGHEGHTH